MKQEMMEIVQQKQLAPTRTVLAYPRAACRLAATPTD